MLQMGTLRLRQVILDLLFWNKEPGISACFDSSHLGFVNKKRAAFTARDPGPEGVLHLGLQAAALTPKSTAIYLNQIPSEVLPVCCYLCA